MIDTRKQLPSLPINPKRVAFWLFGAIVILVSMHVSMAVLSRAYVNGYTKVLSEAFALDNEGNFPAYFSAGILAVSAALFWVVAKASSVQNDSQSKWWFGLFICFCYLSLDEATQIHEKFDNDSLLSFMDMSGLFLWVWVIPYGIIAIIFGAIYFKFWLSLPIKYRILFGICGGLYLLGAIGFEMLGAREYDQNQAFTTLYHVICTCEEALEMTAISALIVVLLQYILERFEAVRFAGTSPNEAGIERPN